MAAQKTYLNTILLLSVVIVKKSVMLNVLKNFTHLTLLKTNGAAGNAVLLKRLDTTHLSLIDMTNIHSLIMKVLMKFIKLRIY